MAIRNFYINGRVDGRETKITGGPARKDGGMGVTITQRSNGRIVETVEILSSYNEGDDTLTTWVRVPHGFEGTPEDVTIKRTETGFKIITKRG